MRPRIGHLIYLHGFASSPSSSKAQRFADDMGRHGIPFTCPDLNQPAFETLTVTRMLDAARAAIDAAGPGPVALVGSSLGGFVALHAAARCPSVDRLVLLAPAVDFGGGRLQALGDAAIETWRRQGRLRVFHHGDGAWRDIDVGLYEDARQYDAFAVQLTVPTLVFHGRFDDIVLASSVTAWANQQPLVELCLLDDDHRLTASLDVIYARSLAFFGV